MSSLVPRLSPDRVRRSDVFAYLYFLLGLTVTGEFARRMTADGVSGPAIAGATLGLFAIAAGALSYRSPDEYPRGTEPASRVLLALAGVATLAFAFLFVALVGRLA